MKHNQAMETDTAELFRAINHSVPKFVETFPWCTWFWEVTQKLRWGPLFGILVHFPEIKTSILNSI